MTFGYVCQNCITNVVSVWLQARFINFEPYHDIELSVLGIQLKLHLMVLNVLLFLLHVYAIIITKSIYNNYRLFMIFSMRGGFSF